MAASARDVGDATAWSAEAARRVWGGAIPLHVHLHDADVTALPPPPPFLTLGPRIGYLPLLVPIIKAHFSSTLPPGVDTVWFEYKGLPLKWYIPIGVLFDLLCAEPERPWNLILLKLAIQLSEEPVRSVQKALYACCKRCKPWLIAITSASAHEGSLSKVDFRFTVLYSNRVHFRGYPAEILSPCEGEDSVKWSYNNSLKEAAFIITGNSKNVMNMSQADQAAMWESVRKGDMDSYTNISTRLKLGLFEEDWSVATSSAERQQGSDEPESPGSVRPCRVPVRLYVRRVQEDLEYLEDAIAVSDWESVSYINRPFEIRKEEGKSYITLARALETLLPEFFSLKPATDTQPVETADSPPDDSDTTPRTPRDRDPAPASQRGADLTKNATEVKLVRVQGIDLQNNMDVPFLWMANYLKNPECYLHVCVYVGAGI